MRLERGSHEAASQLTIAATSNHGNAIRQRRTNGTKADLLRVLAVDALEIRDLHVRNDGCNKNRQTPGSETMSRERWSERVGSRRFKAGS
jgi:hypothetical protein